MGGMLDVNRAAQQLLGMAFFRIRERDTREHMSTAKSASDGPRFS